MAWTNPVAGGTGQLIDGPFMNANVSDPLTFLHSPPACRLQGTAAESIASGVGPVLLTGWDIEDIDNDGMHSTVTDPEFINIVNAGMYFCSLTRMNFTGNATGVRFISVLGDTATATGQGLVAQDSWSPGSSGSNAVLSAAGLDQFEAGDTIRAEAGQTSGSTLSVSTARVFAVHWVGGP